MKLSVESLHALMSFSSKRMGLNHLSRANWANFAFAVKGLANDLGACLDLKRTD